MMQHTRPEHRVRSRRRRVADVGLVVWAVVATVLLLVAVFAPLIRY